MLTRFRAKLRILIYPLAELIAKKCRNPNAVTLAGLAIALSTPIATWFYHIALPILIAVSAYMDALDGAVARLTGRVTKFGAVLDSFCDRVEELCYLLSLALMGLNPLLIAIAVATSYLISYLRALGELRGVRMEGVGLFERGERVVMIFVISIVMLTMSGRVSVFIATALLIAMITLNTVTIIQRVVHIYKSLRGSEKPTLETVGEPSSSSRTRA